MTKPETTSGEISTENAIPLVARPSDEQVLGALRGVLDPEIGENIVDLGMVTNVEVHIDGSVDVNIALTTASCPLRGPITNETKARVGAIEGVSSVNVKTSEMDQEQRSILMNKARKFAQGRAPETLIPASTRVLAIASGKGGVGKSSVTVNIATGLAQHGFQVGILDADIWGFSVPRMLGLEGKFEAEAQADGSPLIRPVVKQIGDKNGAVHVVSMGFLAAEDSAIMWRGLMLNRALQHFLEDVSWGDLDYLLIDMPPGTGDIQMGLARMLPRTEMVVVTTPALAAQKVASRAADMARKGHLRLLGVIENMSAFVCDHGSSYALFGSGGGPRLAEELGVPLIGSIPLSAQLAAGGDKGEPVAMTDIGEISQLAIEGIVGRIMDEIAPPIEMAGCSARMLELIKSFEE